MRHQPFVLPEIHSEFAANRLDIGKLSGQEIPTLCVILLPGARIFFQDVGLIVRRVEGDAEEHQVLTYPLMEFLVDHAKIIRKAETKSRQGATCVNKSDGNHLARKLGKNDGLVILVRQSEIRNLLSD